MQNERVFREMQAADAMRQQSASRDTLGTIWDGLHAALGDVRQKLVEEGVYGRAVTPEAQALDVTVHGRPSVFEAHGHNQAPPAPAPDSPDHGLSR